MSGTPEQLVEGGCACGRVRFRAAGPCVRSGYCHCRSCQKSSGAPVLAFADFAAAGFTWTRALPMSWASSARGRRLFCAACGTQVAFFNADEPAMMSINSATLDEPQRCPPRLHIWTRDRIAWFDTDDSLVRHQEDGERAHDAR